MEPLDRNAEGVIMEGIARGVHGMHCHTRGVRGPNRSSAEYILERPEYQNAYGSCTWCPLADFGTTSISQAQAEAGSGSNTVQKNMGNWAHTYQVIYDDSGQRLNHLGAITNGGTSNRSSSITAGDDATASCVAPQQVL